MEPEDKNIGMEVNGSELLRITPTDAVNSEPNIRLKSSTTVDGAAVQTGGQKVDTVGIPKGQVNVADHQAYNTTDNGGAIAFSAKYHSNGAFTTMGSIEGVKNNNSNDISNHSNLGRPNMEIEFSGFFTINYFFKFIAI